MGAGSTKRWALAVLGLVCVLPFDFISCDIPPTYGVVNENVTLSPSNPKSFTEVLWKKGKDKVIEWDEKYGPRDYGPFKGRVQLNTTFGNLTIFNLTSSDEDTYEIEYETGKETFVLQILERLPDPILNCSVIDENITVNCLIPENYDGNPHLINYSWHCPSAQCNNSFGSVMYFGKNDDRSQNVQCTIHDPVYKRTSSIDLTSCIPREHSRYRYCLIPAVGLTVIVLIVIGFLKCPKNNRTKGLGDTGDTPAR
ncbi:lymphocyte function-associated antigen 3 isoform X1 [Rhinolophus sinicus]|uniref:lymphocyte function-associated antigen 3 isoform X1 n=1 Tax=Rhinolophus sinicus TaxID=89399 RepID=UPI003D7A5CB1